MIYKAKNRRWIMHLLQSVLVLGQAGLLHWARRRQGGVQGA